MSAPVPDFCVQALHALRGRKDRHRPGYWRDYHARNYATRRPYLTQKRREYRSAP